MTSLDDQRLEDILYASLSATPLRAPRESPGMRRSLIVALCTSTVMGAALVAVPSASAATDTMPILDYVDSLRGTPHTTITLAYRNEPAGEDGRRIQFHSDDTLTLDAAGNSRSQIQSTRSTSESIAFPDYTYSRYGDAPWSVRQSLAGPPLPGVQQAEGLILYFTGSANYPKDSIGRVSGDTLIFRGSVETDPGTKAVLETRCLVRPVAGQSLCPVLLDGKLNATIDYSPTGATVTRPKLSRILPANYAPKTHRYTSEKTLKQAAAKGIPTVASMRAAFGNDVTLSGPWGASEPASLSQNWDYTRNARAIARVAAISTRDYDTYLQSQGFSSWGGKFTFDKARSPGVVTYQGRKAVSVYKAHGGYVVMVVADDKATALKVISLLR